MSGTAEPPPVRLRAGPVLLGTGREVIARRHWLAKLAWPSALAVFLTALIHVHALGASAAGAVVWLLPVPLLVLLAVAWHRLVLQGHRAVRAPALGWRQRHTRYLGVALGVLAIHLVLYGVLVVVVAAVPMDTRARLIGLLVTLWFTITLFTPLTLKLPARATSLRLPARTWQSRPAHFGNAALVWLGVVPASAGLAFLAGVLIAPTGAPPAVHLAGCFVGAGLVPLAVVLPVTAASLMFQALRAPGPAAPAWPG